MGFGNQDSNTFFVRSHSSAHRTQIKGERLEIDSRCASETGGGVQGWGMVMVAMRREKRGSGNVRNEAEH